MRNLYILMFSMFGFLAKAGISFIKVDDLQAWEELLLVAKKGNKDLVVFLTLKDCSACKELKNTTFTDSRVIKYVKENYVALEVVLTNEVGTGLASTFQVNKTPALLFLNPEEILFEKLGGLCTADALLNALITTKEESANYPRWAREAAKGNLAKDEYIRYLLIEQKNGRVSARHNIVRDLSSMLDSADFAKPYVQSFVQQLCLDIDGPVFKTLLKKPRWISETANFSWETYRENVYNYNLYEAIRQRDSVFMEDVLFQISTMTVTAIPNFTFKGRQLYLAELNKWKAYDTITTAYLYPLPTDSANAFQREAMFLMEYYSGAEPNSLSLKYLRKGLARKETYQLYFTLCLWLYNEHDLTNAYKAAYSAEILAATTEEKRMAKQMRNLIESSFY